MLPWTHQQRLCEEEDHKGGFLWPDLQVSYIPLPMFHWPELHHMTQPNSGCLGNVV